MVEPDVEIRGLLAFGLRQKGFEVLEASTGREALDLVARCRPRTVVLDMDVSDLYSLGLIAQFQQITPSPILALAGRSGRIGAVAALEQGACDYMARPVDVEELAARLRVAERFAPPPLPEIFESGSLMVDLALRSVRVADRPVSLTTTEYSLLQLFIRHAGQTLTYAQILRGVWGTETPSKAGYVRVYLTALRRKLSNPPEPDLFVTVREVGYRLIVREPWHATAMATTQTAA